jgi:hypothetical protein
MTLLKKKTSTRKTIPRKKQDYTDTVEEFTQRVRPKRELLRRPRRTQQHHSVRRVFSP